MTDIIVRQPVSIVHVLVPSEAAEHGLADLTDESVSSVPAGASGATLTDDSVEAGHYPLLGMPFEVFRQPRSTIINV